MRWEDAIIAFLGGYLLGCLLYALPRVTLLALIVAAWFVTRPKRRRADWDCESQRK